MRISLVLSDGQKLIALRYSSDQRSPSVHLGQGGEALAEAELKDVGDGPNVLVLSEPLDDVSGSWRKVEDPSIVIAHQGGISSPIPLRRRDGALPVLSSPRRCEPGW